MKTVAENEILQDALTKVTPGPLIGFGGLTLDEAIAAGSLTVTEVNQAGAVPSVLGILDLHSLLHSSGVWSPRVSGTRDRGGQSSAVYDSSRDN